MPAACGEWPPCVERHMHISQFEGKHLLARKVHGQQLKAIAGDAVIGECAPCGASEFGQGVESFESANQISTAALAVGLGVGSPILCKVLRSVWEKGLLWPGMVNVVSCSYDQVPSECLVTVMV